MAEKEQKTEKKKKRRGSILAVPFVALAAAIVLLFNKCGIDLPFDLSGLGLGLGGESAVTEKAGEGTGSGTATESAAPYERIIAVTVVGNDYFCNNERVTLDALAETILSADSSVRVEITDDQASKRAYEDLTAKLTQLGVPYTEIVKTK